MSDCQKCEELTSLLEKVEEGLEFYASDENLIQGFNTASGSRYVKQEYYDKAKESLLNISKFKGGE